VLRGLSLPGLISLIEQLVSLSQTFDQEEKIVWSIAAVVRSFLDCRAIVKPLEQNVIPMAKEEPAIESQEDYGPFEFDMDDPEFLAAIGEPVKGANPNENASWSKEEELTAKVHS
jgi:hypothetical protein